MRKIGHLQFALIIEILILICIIFILKKDVNISSIVFHSLFYIWGATEILDRLDPIKDGARWHRTYFHCREFFALLTFVIIPSLAFYTFNSEMSYFFDIPYKYFSLILATSLGMWNRLWADSFTSKLRKLQWF